jgi:hypothetical protein
MGIDNSSLLFGQTQSDPNNLKIIYTGSKVDILTYMVCIDSLKVGQKYSINVESNGCFHNSKLNLIISREADGYFASFKMKGEVEGQKVNTKFKKTKLNNYQIDSVRSFERQLIYVSASKVYCTTVDEYILSIDTSKSVYTVDNCDWQGIGKLVGVLFRKTK